MTRRTLYLPALIVAAVLLACVATLLALSEKAEATFPGKNGRIAYESNGVIYTINPDGSGKTKVTGTSTAGYSVDYSPNGKRIAASDGNGKAAEIYTISVHGGDKSKVTEGTTPSYSPDGKKIAYTGFDGRDAEIYTINVSGGRRTNVTNNATHDYWPSYSPDGKKIVYVRGGELNSEIYTINVGGGGRSKVTDAGGLDSNPSWGSRL